MLNGTFFWDGGGGYGRCSTIVPEQSMFFRNVVEQTTRLYLELF